MVVRGSTTTAAGARELVIRTWVAEHDADRLWAAIVAIRGQAVAEASPVGQAHLAALAARPDQP